VERGTQIGRFVVVSELGRGGMGAVYAAHDPQLDRQVALKVLRDSSSGEEEDRVRMLREGQAMARVTHPNVITVYEVGTEGGMVFLAQELLDGGTLKSWLEKPHEQRAILEKFIAAGRGLEAAHAVGLVHRDFKPENVLLGKDGRIRVADFGLARASAALGEALAVTAKGGGPPRADIDVTKSPMSQLTRTGAVMGTPMFMAPEQHKGERADARSDQFAFCVSLWHALYGSWPYDGKTAPALAEAVIEGRLAPTPPNAKVSSSLRKIMLRGLSTYPGQRYPAMEGLLYDLQKELGDGAAPRRSPAMFVGAALIIAAGAAGTIVVLKSRESKSAKPLPPPPAVVTVNVGNDESIAWLTSAIDRGQFSDAITKYNLAATPLVQTEPARASVFEAAGAYMRVLKGDLKPAQTLLEAATLHAGTDATALAFVDLADAALRLARGDVAAAHERAERCGKQLVTTMPVMASICQQLAADASNAQFGGDGSRNAYKAALALVENLQEPERKSTLRLALAQLDLDNGDFQRAAGIAAEVQKECDDRNAIGCGVLARILVSRVRNGEEQHALELLSTVKPATIEALPVKLAHQIALGEVQGILGAPGDDNVAGLDRIETARAAAEKQGFKVLELEARVARLRVQLTTDDPDAKGTYDDIVKLAKAAKLGRFTKLADAALKELSGPARATLPADGGLSDVREGSSDEP